MVITAAMVMGELILTLNAGSSSLKFAVFDPTNDMATMLRGELEEVGTASHLLAHDAAGLALADKLFTAEENQGIDAYLANVLELVDGHLGPDKLIAVGHRVVHGGNDHIAPERVTPELIVALEALTPLDPIHMPHNLAPMRAIAAARPELAQVACFDTAFHHTLPPVAQRFALPRALSDAGVRRYGFHGLSFEYIARHLQKHFPDLAAGRVIVAHLGAGASLCALRNGVSIATTFGLSTLDGLVMATRCGSLDPGVILYLGRQGHSFADIEDMLYHRSGLLGVSGISGDVRLLLESVEPSAREAIDLFIYRIVIDVGAMASALGGVDGIIFTAGIGEHAPGIRAEICRRLAWLDLRLNETANIAGDQRISASDSRIDARVIATDEEAMIAYHVKAILEARSL